MGYTWPSSFLLIPLQYNSFSAFCASFLLFSCTFLFSLPQSLLCSMKEQSHSLSGSYKEHLPCLKLVLAQWQWLGGKEPTSQCRRHRRCGFDPWAGKIPWRRKWQPTPVFLPGESHGGRSLVGYSPWGHRVRHNRVTEHAVTLSMKKLLLS